MTKEQEATGKVLHRLTELAGILAYHVRRQLEPGDAVSELRSYEAALDDALGEWTKVVGRCLLPEDL